MCSVPFPNILIAFSATKRHFILLQCVTKMFSSTTRRFILLQCVTKMFSPTTRRFIFLQCVTKNNFKMLNSNIENVFILFCWIKRKKNIILIFKKNLLKGERAHFRNYCNVRRLKGHFREKYFIDDFPISLEAKKSKNTFSETPCIYVLHTLRSWKMNITL